jgi:hypothetical protein
MQNAKIQRTNLVLHLQVLHQINVVLIVKIKTILMKSQVSTKEVFMNIKKKRKRK